MADPATIASIIKLGFDLGGGGGIDGGALDKLANGINRSLGTITAEIARHIYATSGDVRGMLDGTTNQILAQIIASEINTGFAVDRSEEAIRDLITYGLTRVNDASKRRDDDIINVVSRSGESVLGSIGRAVSTILDPMARQNTNILQAIAGNQRKIDFGFETVTELLREVLDGVNRKIENIIHNEIIIDSGVFDVIVGHVKDILDGQGALQLETVRSYERILTNTIDGGMGRLADAETQQGAYQKRIADAIEGGNVDANKRWEADNDTNPIERIMQGAERWWSQDDAPGKEEIRAAWNELLTAIGGTEFAGRLDDDCLLPLLKRGHATGFLGWLTVTLTTAMSWGILPFQMATVQANRQLQGFRTCFPDQVISPPQLREMYHILGYSRGELTELFQRQGYSKDDANIIMRTWETVPDITLLFAMYWRGEINEGELRTELRKHGFSPDMVRNIQQVSVYLPPVQDLITMSVRDVFDPATVARNRQTEDFPPEFLQWMRKQGVPDDWSKKYWEAHWRLPSENMGFEMFHRSIITEEELKGLMKSLDIMPGWRDRLIQISYNPLTRVDIRRMHAVGVLSVAEVDRAYRDIGYSPDNAKRLTDFTVKLNEEEGLVTGDVASDLTKSNILGFYKDGTISREAALALLLQEGTNVVAAELLLKSADFDIERAERKQIADIIENRYKNGHITFEEAVRETENRGFTERERERIVLDLELIQAKEYKIPSRTDLDRMVKKGVIDRDTYFAAMIAQGYSEFWAERYFEAM